MRKSVILRLVFLPLVVFVLSSCSTPAATTPTASTKVPVQLIPPAADAPVKASAQAIILATTTSTDDSGLLKYILPDFEKQFGVKVNVIAVGTGQALALGQDGNADVLLVHARILEDEFMASGHGKRREDVMYNDFVIAGPVSDPAGIRGMNSAAQAFKKLAEMQVGFVSRGDESGTHSKEISVWKAAGIDPSGSWYISTGQGMGEVLSMASERQAYTLTDRATFLARAKAGLELEILVEGDPVLFNPYGVIVVNPLKGPQSRAELANKFVDWIISTPVQEKISRFGVDEFGEALFIPDSLGWREIHP